MPTLKPLKIFQIHHHCNLTAKQYASMAAMVRQRKHSSYNKTRRKWQQWHDTMAAMEGLVRCFVITTCFFCHFVTAVTTFPLLLPHEIICLRFNVVIQQQIYLMEPHYALGLGTIVADEPGIFKQSEEQKSSGHWVNSKAHRRL